METLFTVHEKHAAGWVPDLDDVSILSKYVPSTGGEALFLVHAFRTMCECAAT